MWVADIGRIPLLLLDSETPSNTEEMRRVTDRLYGGGGEHRLLQELLLGVGGVRAVRAFCEVTGRPKPDVYHTNEGHAGFQGLERMSELITQDGLSFDVALAQVRASTVFTTHTPVPAGIDRFPRELIADFLASSLFEGLDATRALALGLEDYAGGDKDVFNMAVLGLHLGQHANGVSVLHGAVSRGMFGALWPGVDTDEVPITSITNGVHAPTWVHPAIKGLSERAFGDAHSASHDWTDRDVITRRRAVGRPVADEERARRRGAAPGRGIRSLERQRRGARLDRHHARPRGAHDRLRTPRADVQAPDADAARSRAPHEAAHRQEAAGADRDRRQVAPGRRLGQDPHPAAGALQPRPEGARPDRVPSRLRHHARQDPVPGLRRVAEQPAAPARGVRNVAA